MSDLDSNGYPILLAVKAPGQVAAQTTSGASVRRGARSGNPNSDPSSGRFAEGGRKKPGESIVDVNPLAVNRMGIPQGVDPEEWERRLDAIRDAAREFEEMGDGDAKEFLNGRVNDLSKVDVAAFLADVREQRIDDLIDVLDYQLRSKVVGSSRARRFVRLQAPRGFVKKLFASLTDDEVIKVVTRLSNRGWGVDDLVEQVINRINKQERRTSLEERFRGAAGKPVKLADWVGRFRPDFGDDEYEFDDEPAPSKPEMHVQMPELPKQPSALELADALSKVAKEMPAPVVNVTIEAPKPQNKKIKRTADGLIDGWESVEP